MAIPIQQGHCDAGWIEPPRTLSPWIHARARVYAGPAAGPGRRESEFRAGRECAAQALADAGAADLTVGVQGDRSPRWPAGFVGSISHSGSFVYAAVAHCGRLRSLGIDTEAILDDAAMSEVVPMVLDAGERRLVAGEGARERATLAFSAKESLYKCLYPCAGVFFEFADAELEWIRPVDVGAPSPSGRSGSFGLRLRRPLARVFDKGLRFEGRYALESGQVHTAVELSA